MNKLSPMKHSRNPKGLKLPETDDVEARPELEAWRHGDFLVVHYPEIHSNVAVDIQGETFIQRDGDTEVMFAIIDAIYGVKVRGKKLYPPVPREMPEKEFIDQAIQNIAKFTGPAEPPLPLEDIYQAAVEDFLNDLIKPPKKD